MLVKVNKIANNQTTLPLIPMRGLVVFPDTINQFDIGRDFSINAVEQAARGDGKLVLVCQRSVADENPTREDMYDYGVIAEVKQVFRVSENFMKVLVECKSRIQLVSMTRGTSCFEATVIPAPVRAVSSREQYQSQATIRTIKEQVGIYAEHYPKLTLDVIFKAFSQEDSGRFVDTLTSNLSLDFADKQQVLDCSSVAERLVLLLKILVNENELLNYEDELSEKVKTSLDKNQREFYLREQQRIIQEELGDGEDTTEESDVYSERIKALKLRPESEEKLLKEVSRLRKMQGFTQEASVIRTYIDTVLDLPWNTSSEDRFDFEAAKAKLDADHYGLKRVKQRVLELLAVRSVTDKLNSQIICLVGPPGVGKTSVARSIAECMGRKYVRLSLGGIRDEAEIRGHRKTYVGSMPGRIISALITAKVNNPLILLDEIDKLGSDIKGDPSSALLEVLDPEQNFDFKDNFIEIPFDLSKVLFITTANNPSQIPAPLYDRMEIIELTSYTRIEKFHIAKKHLVKKQMEKHALSTKQLSITDKALYAIIDDYTAEAGVRALEREIASICRKTVAKNVAGETDKTVVTPENLAEFLETPMIHTSLASKTDQIGVCNGLAWTSIGGEIAPLEVVATEGSGKLELTGRLGEVMKESAQLALTIARGCATKYGFPKDFNKNVDIHIHAPEGGVKKDGPSAGVTLVTCLVSALSLYPVRANLAMTGEITLHGRVLPIGGLKEKLLAAVKEGIKTVLIPRDNLVDLPEIDDEIKSKLKLIPVDTVDEVLSLALITPKPTAHKKQLRSVDKPAEQPALSN